MTKRELSSVARRLLPYLPGFTAKADLLVAIPLTHTLRGISLYQSSGARDFYAHVFFQPLFIPCQHIVLNLGWRLGGWGHTWNADAPAAIQMLGITAEREALPFLTAIRSMDDVVRAARKLNQPGDWYTQEAIAYALVRAGHVAPAVGALRRFAAALDRVVDWQRASAERAENLVDTLLSDPDEAQRMLHQFQRNTARELNISELLTADDAGTDNGVARSL